MGNLGKKKLQEIIDECENIRADIKSHTVCFTGHRPQKLPWGFNEEDPRCVAMKNKLMEILEKDINNGYNTFISGMALGFDIICVEMLLKLKKKYKNIQIIGALPCKTQHCKWHKAQQERYLKLLKKLDAIRCIYDVYIGVECMLERDRYMVKNSAKITALYNGKKGGTQKTIQYAKKEGIEIEVIDPNC